ncbi:MAG TPA: DUF6797 domain-containing protein, partial [Chthoniobacteraceae bacterium]|nr:DUF6797 domain-containing protein [Chthoniobacteraceae bacterium]
MKSPSHIAIVTLLFMAAPLIAGAAPKWEEMDYGRFLSATFNNAEGKTTFERKGCATNKGIAIKLGKNEEATALFDTDLCRMAGGWLDGWLKLKGVVFDGAHGPNPQPADNAVLVFQTDPGPGWSKGEEFNDPRPMPTGPGAAKIPLGPLPRDWAKYKGLYWSGDRVVVAYSVGTATLLESPAQENVGGRSFITRTFNVTARGAAPAHLLVANGEHAELSADKRIVSVAPESKSTESRVFIGVIGA